MKPMIAVVSLALPLGTAAAQNAPRPMIRVDDAMSVQLQARPETARRPVIAIPADRVRLERSKAGFERLRTDLSLPPANAAPGIDTVNGEANVLFEPGGRYLIRGAGLGERTGRVEVQFEGIQAYVPTRVISWKPHRIEVEVPAELTGRPDRDHLILNVRPLGANVLTRTGFGFRAARAERPIAIGELTGKYYTPHPLPDYEARTRTPPETLRFEQKGADERCFEPGMDRIDLGQGRLANGFVVARYEIWFPKLEAKVTGGPPETRYTPFGRYSARWRDDEIVIYWGVQRERRGPFAGIGARAKCTSRYRIQLYATGPRGVDPFRQQ